MCSLEADFNRLALLDEKGWTANNHYHNYLLSYLPNDCKDALDIGCGTGAFSRRLAERCRRVTALDLSPEMIRVARSRSATFPNLNFEQADVMELDLPKAHFDCIASIATLHHVKQQDLLVRLRDSLRPGGVLMILDLVQSNSIGEWLLDAIGLGVSGSLRLVYNGRLKAPLDVRKAWEQHGQHDSYLTLDQVKQLAEQILPGASIKRHVLWRYSLIYQK